MPSLPEGKFPKRVTLELEAWWALKEQLLPAGFRLSAGQDTSHLNAAGNGQFLSLNTVAIQRFSFSIVKVQRIQFEHSQLYHNSVMFPDQSSQSQVVSFPQTADLILISTFVLRQTEQQVWESSVGTALNSLHH